MRRRTFLQGLAGGTAGIIAPLGFPRALYALGIPPRRGLLVCVAQDAPSAIAEAARSICSVSGHSLLDAMSEGGSVKVIDSQHLLNGSPQELAYNHLIILGSMQDPLIEAAWQHEAKAEKDGIYIFGFGHFKGDIGYIESDRSPFMHSQSIAVAPFETQVITLTGTSPAGIQLAVSAFLQQSLVNGVIAPNGWSRPANSLLDRDPLAPDFDLPAQASERIGDVSRIGYTQASEDEYRGVLSDTAVIPKAIWRAKYYQKGNWDSPAASGSFDNYAAGLHRRAYGNTLWLAQFSDVREAAAAAPRIAAAAHLHRIGKQWKGDQVPYANNSYPGEEKVPGSLTLWQADDWVMISAMQLRSS
jgi:hypothetical protein